MMERLFQLLITGAFVCFVSPHRHRFCRTDLNVVQIDSEYSTYSINACAFRSRSRSCNNLPHTLLQHLKERINTTRHRLTLVRSDVLNWMTTNQEQCFEDNTYVNKIEAARNMEELLSSALEANAAMSLNLTIANCHQNSFLSDDVYSNSMEISCYLRKLLYRSSSDQVISTAQISLPSSMNILSFSCKNLSRAISLYTALERKLQRVWRDEVSRIC